MFATRLKFNPPHQCTDVIDVILVMDLVTVVAVHKDSDEPYYTVRFQDGTEKQTVGEHLKTVMVITFTLSYVYPNPNRNPITLTLAL